MTQLLFLRILIYHINGVIPLQYNSPIKHLYSTNRHTLPVSHLLFSPNIVGNISSELSQVKFLNKLKGNRSPALMYSQYTKIF